MTISSPLKLTVLFSVLFHHGAKGFPEGAPVEACIFKGPNHPSTKSQPLETFPYEFVAEQGSFKPKDKIKVHLNGGKIRGFFIQAIDDNYNPIGHFEKNHYSKLHDECSSITHRGKGPKKNLVMTWHAPVHGHGGNVYFRATVLEEYDKYWSKVFAKVLRPAAPHSFF